MKTKTRVIANLRLDPMKTEELVKELAAILDALRRRGVIRSSNFAGDLGEYLAIEHYKATKGLPKLQLAAPNTKNFDAISNKGERFTIKSTTGNTTGTFFGMNPPESPDREKQVFDHVIIVVMSKIYQLEAIYELSWERFLKHRKWVKGMHAYNLNLTKKLIADSFIRYPVAE